MTSWLLLLLTLSQQAGTDTQIFDSGDQRVHLVELYTSEGCSSCPPADQWLQTHLENPDLWQSVVPLAFHVDYWDYLGWQDPFARPEHSGRQRSYARQGHASGVYTPGFFVDGTEWRGFFKRRQLQVDQQPGHRLTARIADRKVNVELDTADLATPQVHVAVLGFGLQTQVPRGENRGRRLSHDFVVLGLEQAAMQVEGNRLIASLALPVSRRPTQRQAVAVWVTDGDQQPVQALGGWLNQTP